MIWAWRLGMFIVGGIPAIIGGGLVWSLFKNWTAVLIWETFLLFVMGVIISKGDREIRQQHSEH